MPIMAMLVIDRRKTRARLDCEPHLREQCAPIIGLALGRVVAGRAVNVSPAKQESHAVSEGPTGRRPRLSERALGEDDSSRGKHATSAGVAPLICYTNNADTRATDARRSRKQRVGGRSGVLPF
jgi:hypothetical protein